MSRRPPNSESLAVTIANIAREYERNGVLRPMPILTGLAIGGPRHGEFIGNLNEPGPVRVPIMPPMSTAQYAPPFMQRYCVHGGYVTSRHDGDRHFISVNQVARLYGLAHNDWTSVNGLRGRPHAESEYCLRPDSSGAYSRHNLPRLAQVTDFAPVVRRGVYERKAVADRGVYIYRGEE